jgi:hypothetical protein
MTPSSEPAGTPSAGASCATCSSEWVASSGSSGTQIPINGQFFFSRTRAQPHAQGCRRRDKVIGSLALQFLCAGGPMPKVSDLWLSG